MKSPIMPSGTLLKSDKLDISDDARFERVHFMSLSSSGMSATGVVFETAIIEKVDLSMVVLPGLKMVDVRVNSSNLANAKCERLNTLRTEFMGSRMTGFEGANGIFHDILFQKCKLDLSLFRFATLKDVTFDDCVLSGADFIGAKLENVVFHNCNLTDSQFSHVQITSVDFRGSTIAGMHIQREEINGKIKVDAAQALYFVSLFGLIVE